MEACCSATPQTFFHFKPTASIPSSPSSVSLLKGHGLKPIRIIPQFPLTQSSRQFPHPTVTIPTRFLALAAPATADNAVIEKLPADIQVTETPEPNSRVSFLFFFLFLPFLGFFLPIHEFRSRQWFSSFLGFLWAYRLTEFWCFKVYPLVQVRLSVEVPAVVCDDCYKRVLNEFMKRSKVTFPEQCVWRSSGFYSIWCIYIYYLLFRTMQLSHDPYSLNWS